MQLSLIGEDGRVSSLRAEGEIRLGTMPNVGDPLAAVVTSDRKNRFLLLDLSRTSYIDSCGVGWIVRQHKLAKEKGGGLILHSVPPSVLQILRLLRLETILEITEDEAAAKALAKSREVVA